MRTDAATTHMLSLIHIFRACNAPTPEPGVHRDDDNEKEQQTANYESQLERGFLEQQPLTRPRAGTQQEVLGDWIVVSEKRTWSCVSIDLIVLHLSLIHI